MRGLLITFCFLTAACATAALAADLDPAVPTDFDRVGVEEKLDLETPLNASFTDEDGRPVKLSDFLDGETPVILNLGYYECPALCGLIQQGMIASMRQLEWTIGEQFEIVTVSLDHEETPELAHDSREGAITQYGRPEGVDGWHFLVGEAAQVRALADGVGYGYAYDEKTDEWGHPAVLVVLTPEGRISRYLYGMHFDPQTLKLALVEASAGKIGSTMDRFLLLCFQYDSSTGRYALAAKRLVSAVGALTVLVVGLWIFRLFRRDRRRTSS